MPRVIEDIEPTKCIDAKIPATPAKTELDFVGALSRSIPPLRTVGSTWHVFRRGTWQPTTNDEFKPVALDILPAPYRTIRLAKTLLDHLEAAQQTDASVFRGFYRFDESGAVLINAANCVCRVTVNSIEKLPHLPDHGFTRQTAAKFDPDATAPLYSRVLAESLPDAEDRQLFKLFLGNLLLPDCRFETALVAYGESGRGKSTTADPVAAVLGVDLVPRLSMAQVCDPRSYHLPGLRFAAVNLGTELTALDIGDSGNFKTLVSGEPIEARPIYGKPFVMQTACKLWWLSNTLPRFRFGTEAELRRTRFLRFDQLPAQKDITLKARLAAERDGVFQIMIDGLRELLTLREIPVGGPESRAVHDRFRISNDPVGAFVQACCRLTPEGRVTRDSLKQAFDDFAVRHELTGCDGWFLKALRERFPSLGDARPRTGGSSRTRVITGIQLRSNVVSLE